MSGYLGRESPRPQNAMATASVARERQQTMPILIEA
jgi:hypothetical protein